MSILLSKIQTCKYNKLFRNKASPSDSFSIRLDASSPLFGAHNNRMTSSHLRILLADKGEQGVHILS